MTSKRREPLAQRRLSSSCPWSEQLVQTTAEGRVNQNAKRNAKGFQRETHPFHEFNHRKNLIANRLDLTTPHGSTLDGDTASMYEREHAEKMSDSHP